MTRQITTRGDGTAMEIVFDGTRAELLEDGVRVGEGDEGFFPTMREARQAAQRRQREQLLDRFKGDEKMIGLHDSWISWTTIP